jgi:hypothetical protein
VLVGLQTILYSDSAPFLMTRLIFSLKLAESDRALMAAQLSLIDGAEHGDMDGVLGHQAPQIPYDR